MPVESVAPAPVEPGAEEDVCSVLLVMPESSLMVGDVELDEARPSGVVDSVVAETVDSKVDSVVLEIVDSIVDTVAFEVEALIVVVVVVSVTPMNNEINSYKPCIQFMGHQQIVLNQIRCHGM